MNVIPVPLSLELRDGAFHLPRDFIVHYDGGESASVAEYLVKEVENRYGLKASVQSDYDPTVPVSLRIQGEVDLLKERPFKEEGYTLSVTETGIRIVAEARSGLFYGVQSFFQLLPFAHKHHPTEISIPCIEILDVPQFKWRGALLDVGRHFFELQFIKRFIDHLAFYKLNRFHWHLTEDQGWRIEIKSFPRLTEIGSWRETEDRNGKYGGFYTQDEISEIVAYAKERCIEVMPEIEMPGHCAASLAAYPDLSCKGDILDTPHKWGVYEDVYCAGKDKVLDFLKAVLDEVIQLFPFEYIHIGGDEAPKDRWKECQKCQQRIQKRELDGEDELQTWFIAQIAEYLATKKRKIVGWDEILEGGIPNNATVMSWRGVIGGFIAAKLGHDVIMSPTAHCYLDYRQADSQDEPGAYYATLTLESVYAFDPIPDAQLLMRVDSSGSSDAAQPSSQMEICEMSEVTQETSSGMEMDESQKRDEAAQNGHEETSSKLRPEQQLAEGIQQGRVPPALTESEQHRILGGQANVWTEYIEDAETCEYMLLPRLCAFSEAVWSPKEERDLDDFCRRLDEHAKLFDALEFKYRSFTK